MKNFALIDPLFLPHLGCHLEFSLAPGSSVVFMGENGIGKTTLLKRLALQAEAGSRVIIEQKATEYFYDRKVKKLREFFQEGLLPQFDEEAFTFLWQAFNLDSKEDRLISQLSGGEAQALKLALGLCKETSYFFLDEPSQYLDQGRREILKNFLSYLLKRGKSLVVVEHNREWLPEGWMVQNLVVKNSTLVQGDTWTIS